MSFSIKNGFYFHYLILVAFLSIRPTLRKLYFAHINSIFFFLPVTSWTLLSEYPSNRRTQTQNPQTQPKAEGNLLVSDLLFGYLLFQLYDFSFCIIESHYYFTVLQSSGSAQMLPRDMLSTSRKLQAPLQARTLIWEVGAKNTQRQTVLETLESKLLRYY